MTVEKLERVMWRLRERNPHQEVVTVNELERAIMLEIGTDRRTYSQNKRSLIKLQWIATKGNRYVRLTGNDL